MSLALCLVAAGSGGHIIPGIMHIVHQRKPQQEVLFFSSENKLDAEIQEKFPFACRTISLAVEPVPGKRFWRYPLFLYRLLSSFFVARRAFLEQRPQEVVSMGGLVSVPVCFAAWWLNIPITLYELNAVPGKAVRWLAPLASRINVCFDKNTFSFDPEKLYQVPYPLRFSQEDILSKQDARTRLGLPLDKKVILVLGGSQGSQALNDLMMKLLKAYPTFMKNYTIIHQTGSSPAEQSARDYAQQYQLNKVEHTCFEFMPDLAPYYCAADVVICRAGAGTVFELAFFAKKAIYIPLETSAEGHQLENALAMIQKHPDLFCLVRQSHAEHETGKLYQQLAKALKED